MPPAPSCVKTKRHGARHDPARHTPDDRLPPVRRAGPDRPDWTVRGAVPHPERHLPPVWPDGGTGARREGPAPDAGRCDGGRPAARRAARAGRPRAGSPDGGRGRARLDRPPGRRRSQRVLRLHRCAAVRGGRPATRAPGNHALGVLPPAALLRRGAGGPAGGHGWRLGVRRRCHRRHRRRATSGRRAAGHRGGAEHPARHGLRPRAALRQRHARDRPARHPGRDAGPVACAHHPARGHGPARGSPAGIAVPATLETRGDHA